MKIKMKMMDYDLLLRLNESSLRAGRKQNLRTERIPGDTARRYVVNFNFDHEWSGGQDVRMSVILKPAETTAWLDVSSEEFAAIPEFEVSELEWESAVCVGTPHWVE